MFDPKPIPRTGSILLLVDFQERLLPAISAAESVLANAVRLAKGAEILRIPVFVTEQYPKGLGPTVAGLKENLPSFTPWEKLTFSACGASGLVEALKKSNTTDVVLAGIESHVCVTQTCLDLLRLGLRVFVCADAVGSRTVENCRIGLERMRAGGALVVSTEMVLFEWLERAGTPEFKQIQALLK
jgi:nicotinamidase-related amidase